MKVCDYVSKNWGLAFGRISKAFHDYSPEWVEWTDFAHCDTYMVNIVGGGEIQEIEKGLAHNKKLLLVQHTYFTGGDYDWLQYWKQALLTISFHDLKHYFPNEQFNFYATPWGADSKLFSRLALRKYRKVFTTGHVAETEDIDKLYEACKNTKNTMYHTGNNFEFGEYYKYLKYMSDPDLNVTLNSVQYVSCLREIEGFEMMGVEGLFCGARPIVPNLPTYRWYKDHAVFVDTTTDVVKQLESILNIVPKEPDGYEMSEIKKKFEWKNIIRNIFDTLGK